MHIFIIELNSLLLKFFNIRLGKLGTEIILDGFNFLRIQFNKSLNT